MSEHLPALLDAVRTDLVQAPGPVDVPRVARLLREHGHLLSPSAVLETATLLRDHIEGLGPLEAALGPGITDVLVNDDGTVWTDGPDGLISTALRLDPPAARDLAVRLAIAGGRRLDDAVPCADAHLPSGIRFHAVLPPLSAGGAIISLRLPARAGFDLAALRRLGALDETLETLLRRIVLARVPFLISGGTGTGKSTLLAAMLATAAPSERLVVVEDALELQIEHPHVVHLQSRHANTEGAGAVTLQDLVRQSLRMRPDRVIVGECRGAEIRELLQALNTGHDGGCGTVHANSAADVPARLEALGALGGLDRAALCAQTASALRLVLHLERTPQGRRLTEVALIGRGPDGFLAARTALTWDGSAVREGPAAGDLQALVDATEAVAQRRGRRAAA